MLTVNEKYWSKKYKHIYKRITGKVYSEHQEDGIIDAVFKFYKPRYKYFVDIGAYGDTSSNTFNLLRKGWKGIWFDKEPLTFSEIKNQIMFYKSQTIYDNVAVSVDNLTKLLDKFKTPKYFDFLSIDVDSYEYDIWKNLTNYRPKLVCVEVNQMENDFAIVNYDPKFTKGIGGYGGATIGLMNKLANENGYDYLCWDVSNAFYLRR